MASNNDINLRYDVDRSKFSMLNFGSKTRFRCLTLSNRSNITNLSTNVNRFFKAKSRYRIIVCFVIGLFSSEGPSAYLLS